MQAKDLNSQRNSTSIQAEQSTTSARNNSYVKRAMEIFDLTHESEVGTREYNYVKTQMMAENYGFRGVPRRTYTVTESGVVEFLCLK